MVTKPDKFYETERSKNLAACLLIYAIVIILNCLCHTLTQFKNSTHIIKGGTLFIEAHIVATKAKEE